MEKLESKNVSLDFQVQSLIKERENVKQNIKNFLIQSKRHELKLKNSVLSNTKKSSEKVDVFVRTNKKTYVVSKNVVLNRKIVTDVDVQKALEAKDVLCVSCAKNVLIPYTTPVVSKTRFSAKTTQCESLDTTSVVSRTKIVVVTPLRARNKVVQIVIWIVDSRCSKHMTGDRSLLKISLRNSWAQFALEMITL
ncbi:hypothetical protein Tco_1528124 [Tanacetum coccineum]